MEDKKKPETIIEEMVGLLHHSMKAFDEIRGKPLTYNKFRDTQSLADRISDLLSHMKKQGRKGVELAEVWVDKEPEETKQKSISLRNIE